jgi:hypothetical protein
MKKLLVIVFAALAFSGLASASLIPFLTNISASPAPYTWSYTLHVSPDEQLNPSATAGQCPAGATCPSGTFFTIYDIGGFAGGVAQPAGWTNSVQFTGITPTTQIVPDSSVLLNVTYFYTGATQPVVQGSSELLISGFSFLSTSNLPVTGTASWNATKFGFTGIDQGNAPVQVPGPNVPEPASMLLIGGGLVGLALLRRKLVH